MGYWKKQHSLRGSLLEEYVNMSNQIYFESGLAVVQKIPTPITPVELDPTNGNIKLAYFDKKSTVDYLGNVQGIPICFDAKETKKNYLPLDNIKQHQIDFMQAFDKQDGLSFLIVNFAQEEETFLLPFETLLNYWNSAQNGGRKSIPYSAFNEKFKINRKGNIFLHYLEPLSLYLEEKQENQTGEN